MVRQVQIHMQQTQGQNFFFTLVNVAKAKNRFLLADRKARTHYNVWSNSSATR